MRNSIIGRADGPTAVFLAVSFSEGDYPWLAIFGIITMLLLFLPNIISWFRQKEMNLCESRWMNSAEKLGLLFSLFILVYRVGFGDRGFYSVGAFLCYFLGNILLILLNWVLWLTYYFMGKPRVRAKADGPTAVFLVGKRPVRDFKALRIAMAVAPAALFLLDGLTLRHWLLVGSAIIYGVGHIYVTYENMDKRTDRNIV